MLETVEENYPLEDILLRTITNTAIQCKNDIHYYCRGNIKIQVVMLKQLKIIMENPFHCSTISKIKDI